MYVLDIFDLVAEKISSVSVRKRCILTFLLEKLLVLPDREKYNSYPWKRNMAPQFKSVELILGLLKLTEHRRTKKDNRKKGCIFCNFSISYRYYFYFKCCFLKKIWFQRNRNNKYSKGYSFILGTWMIKIY